MTEFIFVRHGSTQNLELQQWQGWSTVPLSELGREQARLAASLLQNDVPIDRVLSSPIARASETAGIIAETVDVDVEHLDELMERMAATRLWGVAHADSLEYVKGAREHRFDPDWRFEDEESWQDLAGRVVRVVRLMQDLSTEGASAVSRIVLVTHGITLRMIAAALLVGADAALSHWLRIADGLGEIGCCSVSRFEIRPDAVRLLAWNQTGHLADTPAAAQITW
jgi:broad specificity phosphatase PhoE